jgi:hypothetical protein
MPSGVKSIQPASAGRTMPPAVSGDARHLSHATAMHTIASHIVLPHREHSGTAWPYLSPAHVLNTSSYSPDLS